MKGLCCITLLTNTADKTTLKVLGTEEKLTLSKRSECTIRQGLKDMLRRRQWHPTPVLLPGKSHGRRSLVGCSPWGRWGLDMTERLHFHFSLSCTGEGNSNPLQCSCLENPRDRGAWWAAIYGVAQSRTRLKQLSSSSSNGHASFISIIQQKWLGKVKVWQTQLYFALRLICIG